MRDEPCFLLSGSRDIRKEAKFELYRCTDEYKKKIINKKVASKFSYMGNESVIVLLKDHRKTPQSKALGKTQNFFKKFTFRIPMEVYHVQTA